MNTIIIFFVICPLISILTVLITIRRREERIEQSLDDVFTEMFLEAKNPNRFGDITSLDIDHSENLAEYICPPNDLNKLWR